MKSSLVSRGEGCCQSCVLLLPCSLCPGDCQGLEPWLNSHGLCPALPGPRLSCLNGCVSSLPSGCGDSGEGPSTEEVSVPAPGLAAPQGLELLWTQRCCLPLAAGEVLPGLLTNGKAELRLDARVFYLVLHIKKLISCIGQGWLTWKKLSHDLNSLIRT